MNPLPSAENSTLNESSRILHRHVLERSHHERRTGTGQLLVRMRPQHAQHLGSPPQPPRPRPSAHLRPRCTQPRQTQAKPRPSCMAPGAACRSPRRHPRSAHPETAAKQPSNVPAAAAWLLTSQSSSAPAATTPAARAHPAAPSDPQRRQSPGPRFSRSPSATCSSENSGRSFRIMSTARVPCEISKFSASGTP